MDSKMKKVLVAAAAGTMMAVSMGAMAQQAPAGGPRMGMMGPADKATTIERQGLNDPALKLTDAQKAQIDKIVDGYLAEQKTLREKYPMTPGSPPSQEAMGAMRSSRESFNTALGKVLNDSQRKTWEAAQAARRQQMGGGMGGPPPGAGQGQHEHQ